MKRAQRKTAILAGPAVVAIRAVYSSTLSDDARIAALVEISAAAATLARSLAKQAHVDGSTVADLVTDPADVPAVLGRGRWLRTMIRPVPAPPSGIRVPRGTRRAVAAAEQLALFAIATGEA